MAQRLGGSARHVDLVQVNFGAAALKLLDDLNEEGDLFYNESG